MKLSAVLREIADMLDRAAASGDVDAANYAVQTLVNVAMEFTSRRAGAIVGQVVQNMCGDLLQKAFQNLKR